MWWITKVPHSDLGHRGPKQHRFSPIVPDMPNHLLQSRYQTSPSTVTVGAVLMLALRDHSLNNVVKAM